MAVYYDLKIRCPACIAVGLSGGVPSYWYHDCGGRLQVGDNAFYRCSSCQHTSHIKNWRYACASHQGNYRETNVNHFASAISTASQLSGIAGKIWMLRLLENLGNW
jgi:hypothetical protein